MLRMLRMLRMNRMKRMIRMLLIKNGEREREKKKEKKKKKVLIKPRSGARKIQYSDRMMTVLNKALQAVIFFHNVSPSPLEKGRRRKLKNFFQIPSL